MITKFAVRRPVTTLMITLIVILLGLFSYSKLAIDLMPDIDFPRVSIQTDYEGASSQEIENLITRPIEEIAATIQNVDRITSSSQEGRSLVRVHFEWGQNLDEVANDLRAKLDRIRDRLPEEANHPMLLKFDVNAIPIIWLGVSGHMGRVELRLFADKIIKNQIERIEGVAQAQVTGGLEREIHVELRYHDLQAYAISIKDVVKALRTENVDITVGDIRVKTKKYVLRTIGKFKTIDEINDVVVKRINGKSISVRDIAVVQDSFKDVKSFVRVNGKNALIIRIIKQPNANTVKVAEKIKKAIERMKADRNIQKLGIKLKVTMDTSIYIKRSISNVQSAASFGGLIAVFILFVFLGNWRSTFIISSSIVVSLISTFIFLYGAKFTLNMMTFGGLALGIGMLVDNSVVVIENIFRHQSETNVGTEQRSVSTKMIEASLNGTLEVSSAITSSTLTTIVVFLPLFFIEGITGIMFSQLAFMVTFALVGSLVVALSIVPAFSSKFLRIQNEEIKTFFLQKKISYFLTAVEKEYTQFLKILLKYKWRTILTFLGFSIFVIFLIQFVGFDFMPPSDEGRIRINVETVIGTNIETTDRKFKEIEAILLSEFQNKKSHPENNVIETIYTRIGQASYRRLQENAGYTNITLIDTKKRSKTTADMVKLIKTALNKVKGIKLRIRESSFFLFRFMRGGEDKVSLEILGHDLKEGDRLAKDIIQRLKTVRGITYTRQSRDYGNPEYAIKVNRRKAKELNLSVSEIGEYLQSAILGEIATRYTDGEYEYNILVRINQKEIKNIDMIKNLSYPIDDTNKIPMKNLIHIKEEVGPIAIERLNQQRVIYIQGGLSPDRDTYAILQDVKKALSSLTLPKGFYIHYGGIFEEQEEAYSELFVAIILAAFLVYMVMAAQFESFKAPFVIMITIPFSLCGVILIFYLTHINFDVQGFIGTIMLIGIVVNNSIVLVDFIQRISKNSTITLIDAIVEAGNKRLRPILMTSLTTIFALIPLAIGIGEGSEMQIPMAMAVIGGLSFATIISLFLIPSIYLLFFKVREGEK